MGNNRKTTGKYGDLTGKTSKTRLKPCKMTVFWGKYWKLTGKSGILPIEMRKRLYLRGKTDTFPNRNKYKTVKRLYKGAGAVVYCIDSGRLSRQSGGPRNKHCVDGIVERGTWKDGRG